VRQGYIPRPRLTNRLARGLSMPLTLVSAPAGYGKTSLLSAWRAEEGLDFPVAWLSLDPLDNDLTHFLTYIAAALERLHPDLVSSLVPLLRLPQLPQVEELLAILINNASAFPRHFALILDDYHTISDAEIHKALAFLLDHLPGQMHLVILTRSDPPLPLARLLARNQLTEIREEHLRFTLDEASLFLKQVMGLDLPGDAIQVLERRTEGWIAGLQMAGISLYNRKDIGDFINAFQGNDRYVMDYLMEEVFQSQPTEIQDFLLYTSILDRLCPAVCDAVMAAAITQSGSQMPGQPRSSAALLEVLERNNLFLVRLDNKRVWYRYHHLFADLLRYRLQRQCPEMIPGLHRGASLWFKQSGDGDEAMRHAQAAPDFNLAAEVAEEFMMAMLGSSRMAAYSQWVQRLPEEIVRSHAYLCAGCGWVSLLLAWQPDQAERYASMGEAALPQYTPLFSASAGRWITSQEVMGHLTAIRAHAARMRNDLPRAIDLSRTALEELPEAVVAVRCILALNLGLLFMQVGDLDQARSACLEALETALKSGENNNIALNALSVLSGISVWRGNLQEAEDFCRRAFQVGRESGGGSPDLATAYAHGWMTEVYILRHELEAAAAHLEQATRSIEQIGAQENLVFAHIYRVRLSLEQGELLQAEEQAQVIRDMTRSTPGFAHRMPDWLITQAALYLAQGRLDDAARWLQEHGVTAGDLPPGSPVDAATYQNLRGRLPAHLLLARLLLAQDAPDQAYKLLDQVAVTAQAMLNHSILLEALVFQAVILSIRRQQAEALKRMERCLSFGVQEGYVMPFLHASMVLAPLLRQAIVQGIQPAYAQKLLQELEERERSLASRSGFPAFPRRAISELPELTEPLTAREQQILRLLAAGLNSTQIAQELVISVNTARSYIKNLHQKLDAHSRDEAIKKALQLGLL
jgi:LuxR family transcriptional regulator, maltose regulon positive regulatory protein